MNARISVQPQKGFTMVELIMVIVIAGILAIGSVQFIGQATQGYSDAADRQQLATIGWIASEKISRELRNALPNSARLNALRKCLEFIPMVGGSHYLTLPGDTPLTPKSFTAVSSGLTPTPTGNRVAVYPTSTGGVYGKNNPGPLSTSTVSSISSVDDVDTITLGSDFTFSTSSPERRFYFTQNPIMYCIEGTRLNRYSGYGINTSFTIPAASNRQIIVDKLNSASSSFLIAPATLTRNAIVSMHFRLENGATHEVDQEVQIRNVP